MEVHVSLVGRKDLTGEIYRQLRRAILDGRLPPGGRLPPTRELARRLNVSRTTVTVAYDRLTGEGFITSRVGAGTFVSDDVAGTGGPARPAGGALRPRPIWDDVAVPTVFDKPARFDFRTGIPDATLFPYQSWRRLLARQLRPAAVGTGAYGDPTGHPGLRQAVARHIALARGVQAGAGEVVVTNGSQQAVDLVARVLLDPGDRVAVESPGYGPPRRLMASLGAEVAGVPVDDQGLVVEAIPPRTRLVHVTPSHQFPLGTAMSLPRRLALLAWAERHDAAIVEDDYDSEFRYGGRPIEPLQTLDPSGRVIYVGSFSKTLLATLRLGFLVAPAPLVEAVRSAKYLADWHTSLPIQAALADFIDQGLFARHLRRMRSVYQQRHQQLVGSLDDRFADHLKPVPSAAGLHVAATAPTMTHEELQVVLGRASAAGGGAATPVDLRRRPAQPARHRARLWGHRHRRHRGGPGPAPALLRRLTWAPRPGLAWSTTSGIGSRSSPRSLLGLGASLYRLARSWQGGWMRELLGERLGHDRADAGPGGPGRAAAGGRAAAAHVLGDPSRPVRHLGPRGELDAATPGRPNLPGISSPALGAVSVAVAVALSVAMSVALEADGSWSLDSRRSGLELLQAGLNGRAVDFAKLGALYLHRGVWRGRQLVRRRWVADSTRADTRTDPSPRLQYDWWTRPGTGPGNDFWAQGNHGQFVYVAPSRDVVLVRFGTGYHDDHWPDLLATLARRL